MKKGILYTSYFTKLKYGIGVKISIARYNPKWLDLTHLGYWFRDLAPAPELLNGYKNGKISKDEYKIIYDIALNGNNKEVQKLKDLLDSGIDVTVYCYEKPTDFCHRHLLSKYFINLGYESKEL